VDRPAVGPRGGGRSAPGPGEILPVQPGGRRWPPASEDAVRRRKTGRRATRATDSGRFVSKKTAQWAAWGSRGLRLPRSRVKRNRPDGATNTVGPVSFISVLPRPPREDQTHGQGDPRKPRLTGRGAFMRAGHCNRPADHCKGPAPIRPKNSEQAAPTRPTARPRGEERARRLAALRAALAGAAPEFSARLAQLQGGERP